MTSGPAYRGGEKSSQSSKKAVADEAWSDPWEDLEKRLGTRLLVNNAKSSGTAETEGLERDPEQASRIRTQRWSALGVLWQVSTLERVRKCGRVAIRLDGRVDVRQSGSAVGYAGLATCGSVWACPRCSARIQAVRRLEVGVLVCLAAKRGMTVAFGTVTLRHRRDQSLAMLWEAVSKGYQGVGHAKRVRRLREEYVRVGYVRALEVTQGDNGWHPHIHTIQLFGSKVTQEQLDRLADAEHAVWLRQAVRRGLGEPLRERYELRKVTNAGVAFADYFTKGVYDPSVARSAKSIGFEMTGSMSKRGRSRGSRTPWQVLEDFQASGDADDLDVWQEFEQASKGRRSLVWSPGLKDCLRVAEVGDETIAQEEVGDADGTLFVITDWSPIAADAQLGGLLLGEVRRGGLAAGLAFCRASGIAVQTLADDAA